MSKKTRYWIIGITGVLIIVIIYFMLMIKDNDRKITNNDSNMVSNPNKITDQNSTDYLAALDCIL